MLARRKRAVQYRRAPRRQHRARSAAVTDEEARRLFAAVYEEKYDWPMTLEFVDVVYVVRPRVVLGWIAADIAVQSTLFGATATRWTFTSG